MSYKKEILQTVFICTAILGVIMVGESLRVSNAEFSVDNYLKSPTLKEVEISKMTSPSETDEKAQKMVDGFFGDSAESLYETLSKHGAVTRARENAMGIFSSDQISGGSLAVVGNLSELMQNLEDESLYNVAAADSATDAELFDDKTMQLREKLDTNNDNYKKMGEGLFDIKKMFGEAQSRLPALPNT